LFKKILDNTSPNSTANKFRRKRFRYFTELLQNDPLPVKILDVGGTENFWVQMGIYANKNYLITVLNIDVQQTLTKENLTFIQGNAADLSKFGDKEFDIVFSNSVIEHIPKDTERQKMANEIIRTGKKYFVQTPNYFFPFEPHFLFPCFQFLPKFIKIFMLKNFNMGWFKKCGSAAETESLLETNRLLKFAELRSYFPAATIIHEKFMLMTKSLIATGRVEQE
jgi:ubiquinone/menaquinone biosynthesis C-methylase UbiE